jgi:hypothetical protein
MNKNKNVKVQTRKQWFKKNILLVIKGTERNGKQWNQKTWLQTNYLFGYLVHL